MRRVLLAEDDAAIAEPLARALSRQGYEVQVADTGRGALALADEGTDLVVLDLGLPDLDGVEVCRQLRRGGLTMPVLVLTARADEVDAVVGLDAGADDYVTKPFRLAELLARVRALMRRQDAQDASSSSSLLAPSSLPSPSGPDTPGGPAGPDDGVLTVPGLRLEEHARRAWLSRPDGPSDGPLDGLDGRGASVELSLSAKEFDLLHALMREAGTVVPRERLMEEVWGPAHAGSTKTLDMHISWLRRKLGEPDGSRRWITTVRGLGFRFERD